MAISRRQFVTRLGALATVAGLSQTQVSAITEAVAGNASNSPNIQFGGKFGKPRVIWIHGAECTGCSTSILGVLEDGSGKLFSGLEGEAKTVGQALGDAKVTSALGGAFPTLAGATRDALYGSVTTPVYGSTSEHVNIADVLVDIIDLQYHETVMGMGADVAAGWLLDFLSNDGKIGTDGTDNKDYPFVLVIEGALQDKREAGAWNDNPLTPQSWCSIGIADDGIEPTTELDMPDVAARLAAMNNCALVIPVGQCACYGGYPACKPQVGTAEAGFIATKSQTGAKGTYDFFNEFTDANGAFQGKVNGAKDKVVAVPGCPTNPWWFVLTVVMAMVDLVNPSRPLGVLTAAGKPNGAAVDYGRRLKRVYPIPVHSAYCPRYPYYNNGIYALNPGEKGCLQKLGCEGPGTMSLCGAHGWNNQQVQNSDSLASLNSSNRGGHCITAGHPCMGCTEKGYPDSFVPFLKR